MQMNEVGSLSHTICKEFSKKWIKYLSVRTRTTKLSGKTQENLYELGLGNGFLKTHTHTKKKVDKVDAIKTKNFCVSRPKSWDFPGGPVAKTPRFQCRVPRFNPWSGN